jgi:hypothetical protein
MRIRRSLAAVIATAALAGLGLTGAATATAATAKGAPSYVTPSEWAFRYASCRYTSSVAVPV